MSFKSVLKNSIDSLLHKPEDQKSEIEKKVDRIFLDYLPPNLKVCEEKLLLCESIIAPKRPYIYENSDSLEPIEESSLNNEKIEDDKLENYQFPSNASEGPHLLRNDKNYTLNSRLNTLQSRDSLNQPFVDLNNDNMDKDIDEIDEGTNIQTPKMAFYTKQAIKSTFNHTYE